MNILIVDENSSERSLIRSGFEAVGWSVFEASDGSEARDLVQRESLAAVVSEVVLAGINGYELCREVRFQEQLRSLPFILLTASFAGPKYADLARKAGADRLVQKPATVPELLALIREVSTSRTSLPGALPEIPAPVDRSGVRTYDAELVQLLLARNTDLTANLQRMQESEERFHTIFRNEPECVKVVSLEGRVMEMNPAGLAMVEADNAEQVRGKLVFNLVAPEYRQGFIELHERVVRGESGSMEYLVVGLRGGQRWLETHVAPLRDIHSRIYATLSITRDISTRKRVEQALAESEGIYRALTEESLVGVYIIQDGRFIYVNKAQAESLGQARSELLELESVLEGVVPEDRERVRAKMQDRLMNVGQPSQHEFWILRKDGERRLLRVLGTAIQVSGKPALLGTSQDITDQRKAEQRIRQLNRLYALVSDINELIVRESGRQRILKNACRIAVEKGGFLLAWVGLEQDGELKLEASSGANRETEDILKYALCHRLCDFTSQAMRQGTRGVCNDIANDPLSVPWRAAALERGYHSMISLPLKVAGRNMGTLNLYAQEPNFFDEDEFRLLDELAVDIGFALELCEREQNRILAEKALQESEQRFREVAETVDDAFWMTDAGQLRILYISPAYEKIWGRTCASLYSSEESWIETVHPEDRQRVTEAIKTKQQNGAYDEEFRILRPNGQIRWVWDRAFPVKNVDGRVRRIVGVARDITEQRELEAQLRQSQKMDAIGHLAGGVAHDFSNILAAIIMQVDLATGLPQTPEPINEALLEIRKSAQRAADLTRQLLLFSRRQVMQPRQLDLNLVVSDLGKMLQRLIGEDVRLILHLAKGPLHVRADSSMLDQVILNLAVNARDAMPHGGRLLIETGRRTADGRISRNPDELAGEFIFLRVTDTGMGIAPEVMPRIFEPFFTTKEVGQGTGLGLATVFGIVQQHNGSINVESLPGQGASFLIQIPASRAPKSEPVSLPAPPPSVGGSETILLAEDDDAVRELTRITLQRKGYQVLEACNGAEALKIWGEQRGSIALLLSDMVMPGELRGDQLARRLREDEPLLKVILTSGYSAEFAGKGLELGRGDRFLQKPCAPDQLLNAIRDCLDT